MNLTQNYKFAKFGLKTETWHLEQIEHANYEYNTHQYLERSLDYRLIMIIDSEHGTIVL